MTLDVVRISLHLLAATVWVGGQLTLAGLLPALRRLGPEATRAAARQFRLVAWPAYVAVLFTGIWNMFELVDFPHPLFELKFGAFVLSGVGAAVHQWAGGNRALLAVGGAASSLFAVVALFLGVDLRFG